MNVERRLEHHDEPWSFPDLKTIITTDIQARRIYYPTKPLQLNLASSDLPQILISFFGQSLFHNAQVMLDVSQNAVDAFHVFQDVHTLCVGIVAHLKRTRNGLRKIPANSTPVSVG